LHSLLILSSIAFLTACGGGDGQGWSTSQFTRFAYVTTSNNSEGTSYLTSYAVDGTTGTFHLLGSVEAGTPTINGGFSNRVVVHPSGKYVYTSDYEGDKVYQYKVAANGEAEPMSSPSIDVGDGSWGITIHPSGDYLYVASFFDDTIQQFDIGLDGALTPMNPPTAATDAGPYQLTITPDGNYAYAANYNTDNVSQFSINVDGELVPLVPATVNAGGGASSQVTDNDGQYLYVANFDDSTISKFNIGADGLLTEMLNSPISTGSQPYDISIDRRGRFIYTPDSADNTISQFRITGNGELAPLSNATVDTGDEPHSIKFDPSGDYAYVANFDGDTISRFSVASNGELEPLLPATIRSTGTEPGDIAFASDLAPLEPVAKFVYAANVNINKIAQFAIGGDGTLAPLTPANIDSTGSSNLAVAAHPNGKYLYSTSLGANDIGIYSISASGTLTLLDTISANGSPTALTIHPSGSFLYSANLSSNLISQYVINPFTGLLSDNSTAETAATVGQPRVVEITPSGEYAFVSMGGLVDQIEQYKINTDGTLTLLALPNPSVGFDGGYMDISPSGQFLYAADYSNQSVKQFSIGEDGSLTELSDPPALNSPSGIAVDPQGQFVYVGKGDLTAGSTVVTYSTGVDGKLSFVSEALVTGAPSAFALGQAGSYLYGGSFFALSQLAIDADGTLSSLAPADASNERSTDLALVEHWE